MKTHLQQSAHFKGSTYIPLVLSQKNIHYEDLSSSSELKHSMVQLVKSDYVNDAGLSSIAMYLRVILLCVSHPMHI